MAVAFRAPRNMGCADIRRSPFSFPADALPHGAAHSFALPPPRSTHLIYHARARKSFRRGERGARSAKPATMDFSGNRCAPPRQRSRKCHSPPSDTPAIALGHTSHCSWTHQPLLLESPAAALTFANQWFRVRPSMVSRSQTAAFAFAIHWFATIKLLK